MFGELLLQEQLKTVCTAFAVLKDGFISNGTKLCAFVGKAYAIGYADRIGRIPFIKPFYSNAEIIIWQIFQPADCVCAFYVIAGIERGPGSVCEGNLCIAR